MNETNKKYGYIAVRMFELISIAAIVFGAMWNGAETFNLKISEFMIAYGVIGAIVSEITARLLKKASSTFRKK